MGRAVAVDGAGNSYVTGYFQGTATFGSTTLTSAGSLDDGDVFVARLDPSGAFLWAVRAGGTGGGDIGYGVAVDGAGNSYVTGEFWYTATFGSTTLAGGWRDVFVWKLSGCPPDLDGDGQVAFVDLLRILSVWGPCPTCPEDLDDDGVVGFTDLLVVLANWGPCFEPGACCLPDGSCTMAVETSGSDCLAAGGDYQGHDTTCTVVSCPQPGACCLGDGSCVQATVLAGADCVDAGGMYQGDGTECATVECPVGACCLADETCELGSPAACTAAGGHYEGDGTACATVTCRLGACCLGPGDCAEMTESTCDAAGGTFIGEGIPCKSVECSGS